MLFLASQRHNTSSIFAPFIRTLPARPAHALFFTKAEMQRMRGTRAHSLTLEAKALYAAERGTILRSFPKLFQRIGGDDSLRWAFATVSSRAFQIDLAPHEADEGATSDAVANVAKERALVPLMDMFNHKPGKRATWYWEDHNDTICLVTKEHWKEGEEIFFQYAELFNHEILMQHGFVFTSDLLDITTVALTLPPVDPEDPNAALKTMILGEEPIALQLSHTGILPHDGVVLQVSTLLPSEISSHDLGPLLQRSHATPMSPAARAMLCHLCQMQRARLRQAQAHDPIVECGAEGASDAVTGDAAVLLPAARAASPTAGSATTGDVGALWCLEVRVIEKCVAYRCEHTDHKSA